MTAAQQQQPLPTDPVTPGMEGGSIDPDDPLLIAQTLTYVTDNGSVLQSFSSAPFSFAFKFRFVVVEAILIALLCYINPFSLSAHGLILTVAIANLLVVAWFWYNAVRSVEITADGALRFWIGNVEVDVPFDKILDVRRLYGECSICSWGILPHRGYLTTPSDGVAIMTSVPSTPFFMWPRSAGRPERRLGPFACPRLKIVFSPNGGSLDFIREVEEEMKSVAGEGGPGGSGTRRRNGNGGGGAIQPPSMDVTGIGMRQDGSGSVYDV